MKWFCMLSLLFIIYTEISMWAIARLHPQEHRGPCYQINLDFDQVVMNLSSTNRMSAGHLHLWPANTRCLFEEAVHTRSPLGRRSLSIIENHNDEAEGAFGLNFEESIKSDYGVSDPPPIPKRPSKKPVQYRIFSRPAAAPRP